MLYQQHIYMLEQAIMAQEISIPVYFKNFDPELNNIIDEISTSKEKQETSKNNKRESAISEIVNSISANGYQVTIPSFRLYRIKRFYTELSSLQVVVSGASHAASKQSKIPIIQGELAPTKNVKADGNIEINTKLPLILITAHMETFGLVNVS